MFEAQQIMSSKFLGLFNFNYSGGGILRSVLSIALFPRIITQCHFISEAIAVMALIINKYGKIKKIILKPKLLSKNSESTKSYFIRRQYFSLPVLYSFGDPSVIPQDAM